MKVSLLSLAAATMVALSGAAAQAQQGDHEAGEKIFKRCVACHTIEKGAANKIGPNLHGVVGRKAAAVETYKYSDAMKNSGITWTEETLDKYLADPKAFVPGNKMTYAGIKDAKERADVLAYLKKESAE